jgi:dTDP-4-amino-4,6-dideoxygalactose transaminase
MNTFSSFGANYSLRFALKALLAPNNQKSEKDLIKLLEKKYQGKTILTYKCREAITLALESCAFPPQSFVAICKYSCNEVINAIKAANLNPAYVELEEDGLHFSASELKKSLAKNPKIKAVLVQNTLGYPCRIEDIAKICLQKKLVLVEDLAHCVGAIYGKGLEAGSFGDFITLSFSQNKIIDVTSGGALIITNEINIFPPTKGPNLKRQLSDRIYPICSYLIKYSFPLYLLFYKLTFWSKNYTKVGTGEHRLPAWYCYLILARFRSLSSDFLHRKNTAAAYSRLINKKVLSPTLTKQIPNSANFRFPIFVSQKKALINYLATNNVFLDDPWYTFPGLTLPTHCNISPKKAEEISLLINKWLENGGS